MEHEILSYQEDNENNPLFQSKKLRDEMIENVKKQDVPYICKDRFEVYFVCFRSGENYFFAGPLCLQTLRRMELHRYYKYYGILEEQEKPLKILKFSELLDFVELLDNILSKEELDDKTLIFGNTLMVDQAEHEEQSHVLFEMKREEEMLYHHTYQEERKLLDCVREGRTADALRYTRNMDGDIGKMSSREMNHWKNAAIAGITLCTRAAIEGGIFPALAYQLSDYYIQKCDNCDAVDAVLRYRNAAVERLTQEVYRGLQMKYSSGYVEQCKDYVRKHYTEKIYTEDIAEKLGISPNYLSRLFNKEAGMRLQDYITHVRVEKAANLLTYSTESISRIAEYVNFPSQSYLGKVFKELKGMTPKKYRETHKPKEFR